MNLHNLFENQDQNGFRIGDPVIITGDVEFQGKTGDVREIGRDGAFVVVDLYNYGPRSFHASDVSLNDYADSDDEAEYQQGVGEGPTLDKIKNTAKKAAVAFATSRANPVAYAIRKGLGQSHDEYKKNVKKGAGVAEGLTDTQKKIEDTINKLEDRLKHAKSDEQWDRISARIERLQAGLKRSKQGVAEGSENFTITTKKDLSYPGSIQVVITDKSTSKQTVIAGSPSKIKQQIKKEFGIDYNFDEQGVAEASDISGLMTAASMVQDYIITAEVDGQTRRFRVRGMTGPTAARERFLKHASQARVVDVKPAAEKGVAEDAVADFLARGGAIQTGKYHRPRKSEKTDYGSRHIGGQRDAVAGKAGKTLGRAAATAFKGSGKPIVGEKAETNNEQPWVDAKLKRKMDYAFGHYAGYKDKPEAFFKWVMNSLEHSEENDQQHDRRFDRIEREIDQLSQRLKQVNEQHGAAVADRFSQRLAERFESDRPTADPARQLFAESRSQKRAAIREIFANQG